MSGFDNDIMYAKNADFTQVDNQNVSEANGLATNGQLWVGTTVVNAGGTHINVGGIVSPDGSVTVGYSSPNITLQAAGTVATTYQADSGSATPVANILNVLGGPGIVTSGSGNTLTINSFAYQNLGIDYNSGTTTFTVTSSDGSALSATNPAYVTLQSLADPGELITFQITADQSFTQAQLGNNLFGITTGVNVSVDMPFYLYAVSNGNNGENTVAFMISRVPHRTVAPAAGNIGQSGNTNASTQGSFFSLRAITAADYAASPCLCIGSFRMQYSGAGTAWTVQTINNADGIGQFQEQVRFAFPPGQFGANSGNYFTTANAPTFSAPVHNYQIKKDGNIIGYTSFGNSTNGTNANNIVLVTPLIVINAAAAYGISIVSTVYSAVSTYNTSINQSLELVYTNNGGSGFLLNNSFTNGSTLTGTYNYIISTS